MIPIVDSALQAVGKIFGFLETKEEKIDVRYYQRLIKKLQRKNQVAEDFMYYDDLILSATDEKKRKKYIGEKLDLKTKFRKFKV